MVIQSVAMLIRRIVEIKEPKWPTFTAHSQAHPTFHHRQATHLVYSIPLEILTPQLVFQGNRVAGFALDKPDVALVAALYWKA